MPHLQYKNLDKMNPHRCFKLRIVSLLLLSHAGAPPGAFFRCVDAWSPPRTFAPTNPSVHCNDWAGLSIWIPPTTCFTPTEGESSSWCSLVLTATDTVKVVVLRAPVVVVFWGVAVKSKAIADVAMIAFPLHTHIR